MKPKALLLLRLREHVVEPLAERGFRFAAAKVHFTRTVGDVQQRIAICANRHNREDDAEFWSMWSATSLVYPAWHAEQWGKPPAHGIMGDSADWNIPGWGSVLPAAKVRLSNAAEDVREMAAFLDAVLGAGLRWLERVSTWEGAAEARRASGHGFGQAADYFMLAGQPERARESLLEGIDTYARHPHNDWFREADGLRLRLERYFPDSIA
jgi:hypothetical protein